MERTPENTNDGDCCGAVGTVGEAVAAVVGTVTTSIVAVGVGVNISAGSLVTFSANPTA